jgi:CNT family concentrative nucleoside transporter
MARTCGTSGAESLSASANIFVGQTEAPLLIKPYVGGMTRSELLCVMTGGMATVAGGVMAAYVRHAESLLSRHRGPPDGRIGHVRPRRAGHGQAAAAGDGDAEHHGRGRHCPIKDPSVNVIDAAANGATTGLQLALNVGAMLVAFMSLLAMAELGRPAVAGLVRPSRRAASTRCWAGCSRPWPGSWACRASDCLTVGRLMGEKTVLNEFVAYSHLAALPEPLARRSYVIVTYALCGFSNFLSIGIQIGGIGALAPERRSDLARLGWRALLAGSLACFMTAVIAGMLVR